MSPVKSSVSLLENDTLRLAVYSSGHPLPTPARHVWTLNDAIIPNSTTSQDGRELTVPSVQFQRDSRYTCTVGILTGGRFARNSTSFTVTVYGECRRCQWTLEITVRDNHMLCMSYIPMAMCRQMSLITKWASIQRFNVEDNK